MTPLAQKLEAILQRQQPVSSEVFWAQVEAFKDKPEQVIPASSNSFEGLINGRKHEESLQSVNG
ncbi:MAG: hypothetical protein IPK22_25505 [Verrucomicrobiaceae bacterium]|nr:hypothetical protein [Verrucomicrobiaceae bacterium]